LLVLRDAAMLKLYTTVAILISAATGVVDVFVDSRSINTYPGADCYSRAVICTGGAGYYWALALAHAAVALAILLWFGWPIIIAGRIGKARNRRGYLAGIFFGWLGLAWVVLRPARDRQPDALRRAVQDYRDA
jgi:drug/metabolite transporter (DMT)-like permease